MKNAVYIETMGCQMNKLDSELIAGQLSQRGFDITDDPDRARVIIDNTCSVRQHAEDKVISKIGQLRRRRQEGDLVLAIVGCMAQRLGQKLLDEYSQVDVVCSPGQLHRLADMIQLALKDRQRPLALNDASQIEPLEQLDTMRRRQPPQAFFQAYLRVMRGCNKYCSYCVVPYVRGPEQSRTKENIVTEAGRLVDNGDRENTKL